MTIDLEDWYHYYPLKKWEQIPSRIEEPTYWLLGEFAKRKVKATFFILGYIAERHPVLIKEIYSQGHEIGIHGYDHELVFEKSPEGLDKDIKLALTAVYKAVGYRPDLYRAPSFSITKEVPWVWPILANNGIRKDSSLFAARRVDGGYTNISESYFCFKTEDSVEIIEYPILPKKIGLLRVPFTGGGYFRLLPINLILSWIRKSTVPIIFYIHPRDLDPETPVINELGSFRKRMVYYGLKSTREKIRALLDTIPFSSIKKVYEENDVQACDIHGE
ncbi:MAG: polysaccharide deacetylase family protein [Candidatus Brocadia sp.]|nr:polysaccharide deacetylase family protein [Candidatus Brocadia sp.]